MEGRVFEVKDHLGIIVPDKQITIFMDAEEYKYYTPESWEFRDGFEYEFRHKESPKEFGWKRFKTPELNWEREDCPLGLSDLSEYRVKYLDKDDIEDLGATKRKKDTWIGWEDYGIECGDRFDDYFRHCTIHVPRIGEIYKICVHRYLTEECNVENDIENGESIIVFRGYIKNKSELTQLLKRQLRIIK